MKILGHSAIAICVAAALAFSASSASADEPEKVDESPSARPVVIDSTKYSTLIEKLASSQDQRAFEIPLLTYDQPTWTPVCITPCSFRLDPNAAYRIGTLNNVTPTHAFSLTRDITALHVRGGNAFANFVGRVLIVAGAFVIASGVATTAAAPDKITADVGLLVAGSGLLGVIVGIPMAALSQTSVRFE